MEERIRAVNELIKEQIGGIIFEEISSYDGFITVLAVDTTRDLRNAKIWLSFIGDETKIELIFSELRDKEKVIQGRLNKLLSLKHVPKITFCLDRSGQYSASIEEKIRLINGE